MPNIEVNSEIQSTKKMRRVEEDKPSAPLWAPARRPVKWWSLLPAILGADKAAAARPEWVETPLADCPPCH